jgi:hypothetical protein
MGASSVNLTEKQSFRLAESTAEHEGVGPRCCKKQTA